MKPNFRVLCGILLLCFASARSRTISDGNKIFLDDGNSKESISNEERDLGSNQEGKDIDDLTPFFRSAPLLLDEPGDPECITECGEHPDIQCDKPDKNIVCSCKDDKVYVKDEKTCKTPCLADTDCKNGAKCTDDDNNKKFCKCEEGSSGDFCENVAACNVDKFKYCKGTNGTCILDKGSDGAKCECSGKKEFDNIINECREQCSNDDNCENGATCGDEKFCACAKGTFGDKCEKVYDCLKGKYQKCDGESGTCAFDKDQNKAICTCKEEKKLDESSGYCREPCDEGKCKNGGTCPTDESGEKFCECKDGSTGDFCQTIPACEKEKYKYCKGGNGTCVLGDNAGEVKCECQNGKKFDEQKKECRGQCSNDDDCENGAKCGNDKFCACAIGTFGDKCEYVYDCLKGKYQKCDGETGTCTFDKDNKKAICTCKEDKKLDESSGYCREPCVDGKCKNGGTCPTDVSGEKFCKCKDGSIGDFCQTIPACEKEKYKYCKGDNGTCVLSDKAGEVKCECQNGKKFDEQKKECRGQCSANGDCENGAKCGDDKFCACADGTFGDKCENVYDCLKGKYQKCDGERGTCAFDKDQNKAICTCKEGKKVDESSGYCREPCDEGKCKNGGTCPTDGSGEKFCKCKDGSTGDFCQTIPACEKEKYKHCKGDNGTCVLGDNAGEVKCDCQNGKKFDEQKKECREQCSNDGDCENGAKCGDDKFCACPVGTFGDKCENVYDCLKGKYQKCDDERGTCTFDKDNKKAICTCKEDKKLDESSGYCRETCDGEKKCKNGAKCNAAKFCECPSGFKGDFCEIITSCENAKFKNCKGDIGSCVVDNVTGARCDCKGDKKFDDRINECRETCGDKDCKNGGNCTDDGDGKKFCKCETGSSGDFCKTVAACNAAKFKYCKGDNGTCVLDKNPDGAKCECSGVKKFDDTIKACRDQCGDDEPCDNGGTCEKQFCTCLKGTYGDKCEKVYDCLEGKYKNCNGERGTCAIEKGQKKATCTCEGDKKLDPSLGYCRDVCKDDDCKYKGKCTIPTGAKEKFCNCNKGTTGDYCETVVDCQEEKFCGDGNDVKCDYNTDTFQAECKCTDKTKGFDGKEKICRKKCEKNEDCQADKEQCTDKLCICKDGLGDEDCTKALGCNETLTKICEAADAKCVYDEGKKEKATCKCSDDEYDEYDENERKCKPKFCMAAKCGAESECVFDKEKGIGICKCKDDEKYYDYKEHKCSVPDPCVLKKTSCEENEECSDGNCKCKKGFKKVNETCVSKMCDNKACLDVGDCKPVGDSYTCTCPEGKYFDGSKCADSSCIDKDFKTKCKTCVNGFHWNKDDKKCVRNNGTKLCDDECGYGYCIIENDKNTCRCITTVATEKKGKCVLKSSICASGKLTEDSSKCDCKGIYEDAEDKITCQLKTCTEKTQKECQAKRATCVMVKKGGKLNYDCKCQTGYVMDPVLNTCIDACSSQKAITGCYGKGQQAVCFNSESDLNSETGECECFPPLTNPNKNCSEIATDVYMIRNIPVLKKEYERNGEIDKVLLNAHLIQSMRQTFVKFKHGYLMDYKLSGNTLDCSIWIEFKEDPTSEVKRIQQQVRTFNCTDCDTNLLLWPPHVLIASKDLNVVPEKLGFCSKDSKDKLCGKEALCANNTCSCPKGYSPSYMSRVITETYTIQRCEDIDECSTGTHRCPENTTCVNDLGDYHCKCLPNFKKEKDTVFSRETIDKLKCVDMCTPNPCGKGDCKVKEKGGFDCSCSPGYGGTFCDRADVNFASAKKSAVTVGAILGTLLGVTLIAFFLYYRRVRKNSYSEDFAPASRGGEEMTERRPPMRGMINRSYE